MSDDSGVKDIILSGEQRALLGNQVMDRLDNEYQRAVGLLYHARTFNDILEVADMLQARLPAVLRDIHSSWTLFHGRNQNRPSGA